MRTLRNYLAHLIGKGPFEREIDFIPGVNPVPPQEYLFFQDDGRGEEYIDQQGKILIHPEGKKSPPLEGSVFGSLTRIRPKGQETLFLCLMYWNDKAAWKAWIEEVAEQRELLLAEIVNDRFVINDGSSYDLASECSVEFKFEGKDSTPRFLKWPEQADEMVW